MIKNKKKEPENNYRKPNNCPYCGYFCDAATMVGDKKAKPKKGDLSFCIMCSESSIFAKNMKMVKFDLNSIDDIVERNRLKACSYKIKEFWDLNPELAKEKRDKYFYDKK